MSALISCIIPVYNSARFIGESLESVFAQTYPSLEVLVVDDGSTDDTPKILEEFGDRIKVIRQENAGPAAARSRGFSASTADFVAFQDADDIWVPEKLELQMDRLQKRPEAELCNCLIENFWETEQAEEEKRLRDTDHAKPRLASWQGVLARRRVFDIVGGMDAGVPENDAREWMHRARTMDIVIEQIDEVLVRRRVHSSNWSRRRAGMESALLLRLAERALARRQSTNPEG